MLTTRILRVVVIWLVAGWAGAGLAQTNAAPQTEDLAETIRVTTWNLQPPATRITRQQTLEVLAASFGTILALVVLVRFRFKRKPSRKPAASALLANRLESCGTAATSYTVILAPLSATSSAADSARHASAHHPVIYFEPQATPVPQSTVWRQRALAAERRADEAQAILREGLLPCLREWLRQTLVRKLIADRANLLEAQQAATLKALAVDERLARIEVQVQQQNQLYERRIEELTRELLAAKAENRELIRAQINRVKAEMEAAGAPLIAEARAGD